MMRDEDVQAAREVFPAGLEQPEGGFRFSRDALLLSDFAKEKCLLEHGAIADLGTGCGVAALAFLLSCPGWSAVGLEVQPALVQAARRNSCRLGLEDRMLVLEGDVSDASALKRTRSALRGLRGVPASSGEPLPLFDAVLCNPPWCLAGTGRTPSSDLRRGALFGTERTLPEFFHAADALLKQRGMLVAVFGAERLASALAALPERLHAECVRLVFTKGGAPATFALLLARKNGRAALRVEKSEMWTARNTGGRNSGHSPWEAPA